MRRVEALDGMRGYFLVFMVLNHLTFTGGYRLVKLNHGELGYVQDAQGFVFLSGLLVGMIYARQIRTRGYDAARTRIRRRAFEIWRMAVLCLAAIGALAIALPGPQPYWKDWLWQLGDGDPGTMVTAGLMLYQPTFLDILPQYVVYMIAAPPLVRLVVEGRWRAVVLGSAILWGLVQFGLHLPLQDALDAAIRAVFPQSALRAHFNVLAWQALFTGGLVIGALSSSGQLDLRRLFDPDRPGPALLALGGVLFFMAWRLGFTFELVPERMAERFRMLDIRGELSAVYVLNFAATGYLVAWVMIAGPERASGVARGAGLLLHRLFALSFLRLIGRHSLEVYAFHVSVIFLLKAVDAAHPALGEVSKTAIALAAVASLAIPALWKERRAVRPRSVAVGA